MVNWLKINHLHDCDSNLYHTLLENIASLKFEYYFDYLIITLDYGMAAVLQWDMCGTWVGIYNTHTQD